MHSFYHQRNILLTTLVVFASSGLLLVSLVSGELFKIRPDQDNDELAAIGRYLECRISLSLAQVPQSIDDISASLEEAVAEIEAIGVGEFGKLRENDTNFLGEEFIFLLGTNPRPLRLIMKNFIQLSSNSCEREELEFIELVEYMSTEGELINRLARNHLDRCWDINMRLVPSQTESSISKMGFTVFDLLTQVAFRSINPIEQRKMIEIPDSALAGPRERTKLLKNISFETVQERNRFLRALSEKFRSTLGPPAYDKNGKLAKVDVAWRATKLSEFLNGSLIQPCYQLAARIKKVGYNLIHYDQKRDALSLMRQTLDAARSSSEQLDYQMEFAHLCELVIDNQGLIWTQVRDQTIYR